MGQCNKCNKHSSGMVQGVLLCKAHIRQALLERFRGKRGAA